MIISLFFAALRLAAPFSELAEMHWRVRDLSGKVVATDAPSASLPREGGTCEMWIRSPKNQIGGAYVSFASGCGCSEPKRLQNADWRDQPRWNRHLASVRVNGTDYFPREDEKGCVLPMTLFEGWNRVELSVPAHDAGCPLQDLKPVFVPIFGTAESPRPIPGIVCRATPPEMPRIELQPKIDAAAAAGGGAVVVPRGEWETGPLVLRSNVTLRLEDGARLNATTDIREYDQRLCHRHFIFAENATNVAIVGRGVLDAQGGGFREQRGLKGQSQPQALVYVMRFSRCRNVRLEDFTYQRGGAWGCHLRNCDGVTIRNLTCFNHANKTNDGIDIESSNVLVENCTIDADDDAIVIKSESDPSFAVTNITVRNCRLASCCYAFKFGTGSWGDFRDVTVEDCVFFRPQGNYRFKWRDTVPGVRNDVLGSSGFGVDIVDGGRLENFTLRNVVQEEGYHTHSFIRLGGRNTDPDGKASFLRKVLVENYRGRAEGVVAASITGIPGRRVQDVVFRNLDFRLAGGCTAEEAAGPVPESIGRYPGVFMFDAKPLPAYGFYVRHADGVRFESCRFDLDRPDARERYVADDAAIDIR